MEKIKVLKALKPFTKENVTSNTVRAQYVSGHTNGNPVQGYIETLSDNASDSETETYVALRTEIQNWRWAGVPIYLRTGKRMETRHSDIIINFKRPPHALFGGQTKNQNRLVIRLQPDESVRLFMDIKEPGAGGMRVKSLPLNLTYADNFFLSYPDAYERLLMDIVRGNLSLFMRRDEVETAWKWVDGLIASWNEARQPLHIYRAGTKGPSQSDNLFDEGQSWVEPGLE